MARSQDVFGASRGSARVGSHYLGADVNIGYSFGSGSWFVRPNLDASAIRLTLEGFDESGLAGLGMRADKASDWYLAVEPKLTIGARFDHVHFSVTGGGMFSNKDTIDAPMRFLGAASASDPAIIRTLVDKQAFVGGVELGVEGGKRWDVSIGYQGYLGSKIESHTAEVNLRVRF